MSLGGLAGSAGGAVASVTMAGNVAAGAARWAMATNRIFGQGKPYRGGKPDRGDGGGKEPSGSGPSGSSPSPGRAPAGDVQKTIRTLHAETQKGMRRSSAEGTRNYQPGHAAA